MARLCNRRWCWPEWRWNACWCGNSLWLLTPGRAHGCDWSNAWGGCWRCGGGCRGNRVGLTLSCCNCEFSLWWWLLMVVTMALRWAIYGTWMGYLWHLELVNLMVARDLGTRNVTLYFFWTRIIRITRMFFCTLEHEIFLNTNNANDTNIICTRILLCFFNAHGSHGSHGSCSQRGAHWGLEHEIFLNTN